MNIDGDAQDRSGRAEIARLRASHARAIGTEYPFITISRQTGAGGQLLAKAMLEVFARQDDVDLFDGWHVFDRRLCEIVAEDPQLAASLDSLLEEHYRSRAEDFLHHLWTATTDQDFVMQRVFRVVRTLAGVGKAIIVGRGGAQVTRDMPNGVSLRLVGPEPVRIARLMAGDGVNERQARGQARTRDAHRARLVRRNFHVDIDDPLQYDVMFNTDRVVVEDIAEAVAGVLRRRAARS